MNMTKHYNNTKIYFYMQQKKGKKNEEEDEKKFCTFLCSTEINSLNTATAKKYKQHLVFG